VQPRGAISTHIRKSCQATDKFISKSADVARLVGISPSAIRGWEALGLTRPHRTESRYRIYTTDDVNLLKKARYLRKVRGLNAAAIVQILKPQILRSQIPKSQALTPGGRRQSRPRQRRRDRSPVATLAHQARKKPRRSRRRRRNFRRLSQRPSNVRR